MNPERMVERLASLNFRQAVWLFPITYTLHVLEELPQFTNWARRYASANFTMRDYLVIHVSGIVVAFISPLVIRRFPNRTVIFIFFTFIFTPAVCFNVLFHAGSTAAFGAYSPGLLTALTLYPLLYCTVTRLAFHEGFLTNRVAIVSLVLAGAFHAADVSHNVFKAW